MTKTTQVYDESSIQVLKGLEPVQQRPGMYTRLEDPTHIILEVVDNACDEALAGFANKIHVNVHEDQSVSISDNGRGIPTGMHPTEGAPVIELVFTRLHAGGKFNKQGDGSAYKYSGGLHGVGVSVTNALTDKLDVKVVRDGGEYIIGFEKGLVVKPLTKVGKVDKSISGTSVRAWPTAKYFDQPNISHAELERTLRSKAMLLPGVEMTFSVEGKESKTWHYPEGMAQYLNDIAENPEWLFPPIKLDGDDLNPEGGKDGLTCVIGFVEEGAIHRESFVNLIPTRDGGRHMQGLRYGAFQAVQQFMERHQLLPKNLKLEYDDVWSRMSCVLAMRMVDPQFQGQTKDQLSSKHASKLVEKIVSAQFELWLHEHPQLAKTLAELVTTQAFKRSKNAPKSDRKRSAGGAVLPGKLADCESTDVNHTELFLCEGDSAAGCFVYETLIPLADGRKMPIGLMAEEQKLGIKHFVFSVGMDGNIEIAEAIDARKTKVSTKIIELILDNGEIIRCTPEHLFMMRDGSYIEAQNIKNDISLMLFAGDFVNAKTHLDDCKLGVKSIKFLDKLDDVYDFEVPVNHNFALSAGIFVHNSSKMGRERKNQAVLPLRGKILNTWSAETESLDSSKTIEDIITAIGVEPHGWDENVNLDGLRYGKIIIMADADVDGRHIQVLLLTLFLRHFPQLVTRGHIYLAQPPLFRVDAPFSKKAKNPMRKLYALDEEELQGIKKGLLKEGIPETQWTVNRFKGLGEMNPDQLCETTMHPQSRRLVQPVVTKEDWEEVKSSFDMMMNEKNASLRRAWMEKNGNDADIDI